MSPLVGLTIPYGSSTHPAHLDLLISPLFSLFSSVLVLRILLLYYTIFSSDLRITCFSVGILFAGVLKTVVPGSLQSLRG